MSTTGIAIDPAKPRLGSAFAGALVGAVVVIGLAVAGAAGSTDEVVLLAVVAGAFAAAAVFVALQRPHEPLWVWTLAVALAGAIAVLAPAAAPLLPFVAFAFTVALPEGRMPRELRWLVVAGAVVAIGAAVVATNADNRTNAVIVESIVLGLGAVFAYVRACRRAGAVNRSRLQWVGWGVVVAAGLALAIGLLKALLDWPSIAQELAIGATLFVPFSVAVSSVETLAVRIDRLLVHTIEAGGIVIMVGAVYLVVVLGFGDAPDQSERRVLGLSMVAAVIAALLYGPVKSRLSDAANRRVYGERQAPDEPLQTFGARMSRAIPLEELLLQLAESLKKSMQLSASEVWTGTDGVLELAASVPFREPPQFDSTTTKSR